MNILSTARKTISIFVSSILLIGTITTFYSVNSLSMEDAYALSDVEKHNIICNNFNLNANGFNVNAIPEHLSGLLPAQAQARNSDIGTSTFGTDEKRFGSDNKKDFSFVCLNNNNNEFIIIPIDLDLAIVNLDSNNISILLGNGNGTFDPAVNFGVGTSPISVAVGNFN